ncbi:MAG: DUF559 domain-containing protein [Caulobacter sp.]|nr:DUF559 domain-containing protein [Caulobacter sp.]
MRSRRSTVLLARALRRELSLPEGLLWRALRGSALAGARFRRQQPLGPYVGDFYCASAKLVIEVDGASHGCADRPWRDQIRDGWMRENGFRTLRLPASLVLSDMDTTLRTILAAIDAIEVPPPGREASRGRGTAGPT